MCMFLPAFLPRMGACPHYIRFLANSQIFLDGNKRASVIFANHYLISHGGGFLVIPEKEVPEFKRLLVKYYEGEDITVIADFMKKYCWKKIE